MADLEPQKWHEEVVPASTAATLRDLHAARLLDSFYLAGGTGLALRFGHRVSVDLDFFAPEHFDEDALLQRVQALPQFAVVGKAPFTLHATIGTTKVSFLGYAYSVLFPASAFLDVPVADSRDIACMKVSDIASRGTKRDFVDLYFLALRYDLQGIIAMFDLKYAQTNYSRIHILKSLTFFADAEKDPMPHMLVELDWRDVKRFFLKEVPRLL